MADDIVSRCRAVESDFGVWLVIRDAADEIERLRTTLTDGYWNVRHVLECANGVLPSPHPLWSELNELMETCSSFEKILDIPNRWEFIRDDR